jgi:Ca2+-binding EF-hand superfamily protein
MPGDLRSNDRAGSGDPRRALPRPALLRPALIAILSICIAITLHHNFASAQSISPDDAEIRHVVLLLEPAPLCLRLRLTIAGQPLASAREQFVNKLIQQLDRDGDGQLTRAEAARSPLLRQPAPAKGAAFLETLDVGLKVSAADVMNTVQRVAGESVVYRQDDSASESDSFIFELLDEDKSGVIDAAEMATAAERLTRRDTDGDDCIAFDEVQPPPPEQPADPALALVTAVEPARPRATFSELLRDTREPLLPRRILRKYDRDGDGRLSAAELQWPAERIAAIDQNADGALSLTELRDLAEAPVDLDLAIDVAPDDPLRPQLAVLDGAASKSQTSELPGLVNVKLDNATVSLSYRHIDPIPQAIEGALVRFNQLDTDGNGYLDAEEVQTDVRLRRGLFDMIDADGDGKVFGEEVETYVRLRGEPEAIACRVNVYDTGSGFFQSLDHNNDGRIGQREMRSIDQTLQSLQRDDRNGVALEEPARHFHVEFVRGGYRLFGPTDEMVSELPAFNRGVPVGPVWFQRMDRNNDGDLTWREFLGHREDFHRLDADADGLIAPDEAEMADE